MPRFTLICCIVWFSTAHSLCQARDAYLQSSRIFEGDIAELIIQYDGAIPSLYALDTSVLETDFEVLSVKSRLARVIEADEVFHRMHWEIQILPRRNGSLKIPALQVGDLSTPELTLEVVQPSRELSSRNSVFVEMQANPTNPYPGQQVDVVMRLFHNLSLFDGGLIEPESRDAEIYRSGVDTNYSVTRDGRKYSVLERSIALVARSPGELIIPPTIYRGRIKSEDDTSTGDSAMKTRRINRSSEALQLQVRNLPPGFSDHSWLPARQLSLEQHWDKFDAELKVGDSLGLTLTIEARGLAAAALPANLLTVKSDQFKIYADQETSSNRFDGQELIGRLEQRFAVIVTRAGEVDFPATTLKWWDIDTEEERIALLEGKNFTVASAQTAQTRIGDNTSQQQLNLTQEIDIRSIRDYWIGYTLTAVIILICGVLVAVKSIRNLVHDKTAAIMSSRRNRSRLKQACLGNDPVSARHELIKWSRERWPAENISGLHHIESRTRSAELIDQLARLDAANYASHDLNWQGQELWRLLALEQASLSDRSRRQNTLPNLYPQRA